MIEFPQPKGPSATSAKRETAIKQIPLRILQKYWSLTALILLSKSTAMAATYYSAATTGDPSSLSSWTNSVGANPADFVSGDTFEILNGCNYTLDSAWAVTAGASTAILVDSGGTLTINAGTLTLTHGSAVKDLDVNGTLIFSGAGQVSLAPNATVVVEAGIFPNGSLQAGYTGSDAFTGAGYVAGAITINGTYQLLKNNGVVSTCTWATGSTLLISPLTSSANYPANAASLSSQTFYNVVFNLTNQVARCGTSSGLTGNLNIQGDLTFLNTFKTNPIAGAGTITASIASPTVTGSGTTFNAAGNGAAGALTAGSVLYDGSGNFIGIVSTVASATSVTLLTNAAIDVPGGSFLYVNQFPLVTTFGNSSTVTIGGNLYIKGTSWIGLAGPNSGTQAGVWILSGSLIADPNTLIEGSAFGNRAGVETVKFAGSGTIQFPTALYASSPIRIFGQYGIDASHGAAVNSGFAVAYQITGNYKLLTPWRLNFGGNPSTADKLTITNNGANYGTLDCGPYNIYSGINTTYGSNTVTVADGCTLRIGSAAGITTNLVSRSGTITTLTSSKAVTGVGTAFDTELATGNVLYDGSGTVIGVVGFITNSTSLSLSANASIAVTGVNFQASQGTVQVLGTKTYSTAANYVYNGTAAQKVGSSLPTIVNSLTLSNTLGTVTLNQNQNTTITNLTIQTGATLDINGSTITTPNAPVLNGGLVMEVTKTSGVFSGSKLTQTAGTLNYGGSLTVTESGEALAVNDFITLFSAPTYSGSFTITNLPTLTGSLYWTNNLLTAGTIAVLSSSSGPNGPGVITNSMSTVSGITTLKLQWPASQGWRLVSQTNSLSVGLTTNGWNTVSGGIDGSNSIPVNPNNPTVFYKLVYP